MNYAILIMDYFIGLIEYGNTPHEAEKRATGLLDRFASKMDEEDMKNTLDIMRRLVGIMEV